MKKLILIIVIVFFCQSSFGQDETQFYSKDFNWRLDIPDGYSSLSYAELDRLKTEGEKLTGSSHEFSTDGAVTVFAFKSDNANHIRASYVPLVENETFLEHFKLGCDISYEMLHAQLPNVTIDTISYEDTIDKLIFKVHKINLIHNSSIVCFFEFYSRQFDEKILTVNLIYADENKGKEMRKILKESKFK